MDQQMGNAAGAFKRLPQYTRDSLQPISLASDQQWRDASRTVRHFASREAKTDQAAVSREDFTATVQRLDAHPALQAFMVLMWACAARPGDVLKIRRANVKLHESEGGNTIISVLFEEGKVLKTIDPYTIHSVIPDRWAATLRAQLNAESTRFLFHLSDARQRSLFLKQAREELRRTNGRYDLRAVRRGAAQTLAADGVPLSTVMLFTRHATVGMLRRYLGFGQAQSEEASKATVAASVLW
eukprot:PhM_4_TR3017/c2_g6_i3/m.89407